ncbi:MAG: response regulator [Verrucomicrobiota bacterium]
MPSLRVLPVGNPMVYGELLPKNFPGSGEVQFDFLAPQNPAQAAEMLKAGGIDLVLFVLESPAPEAMETLKTLLKASGASGVIVLSHQEDAGAACIRCGAQDFLSFEGLTAQGLARALHHAWERHGFQRAAKDAFAAQLGNATRSVNQLTARIREVGEERIRAEKALVETVARYRFLLDSLPQIVWTADTTGALVYLNRYWVQYSGQSIEQTLTEGWGDAIHPDDAAASRERQRDAILKGEPFGIQHRLRATDGTYRWHELRAVPRRSTAGKILEWIGTEVDIDDQKRVAERLAQAHDELGIRIMERTSELAHANELLQMEVEERRRAEMEAQKAREIAEAANRSKTEFLANISHEIRTPMNGIIGMTDLALETDLTIQQREYLQLVAHSADSLLLLINDMLDFAKIEAGRLELENAPFDVRKVLQDSVKALSVRASQKGIGLNLEIQPDVPAKIVGDANRLRQVMVNLLGNAIKFTEKGEVGVHVHVISTRNDRINLLFEISDTGIGIPEDKQNIIFEAFAQVDGSMTRRFGGTGLGLAIVSSLVKKMDGDIRVRSKLGEGSTFAFNLPAGVVSSNAMADNEADGDVAEAVIRPLPVEPQREAGLRVMIVAEERSETAITLAEMLKLLGLDSTVVGLGEAALGEIERAMDQGAAYRLVMVDSALGDMSGDRFILSLAEHRELKVPVVLMLAGSASPEEVKKAWASGPDWILYKPVIHADLVETLERSMLMVEPAHVRQQQLPESATNKPNAKPPLRVLVAEDNMVNQIVVERILLSFGCDITTVPNGRQAVEAVENKPFDLILMDIQMPEMDGMEATRMIRSLPDHRAQLPIVAMTAHAMKGDRERFLASGMDHYISKPFHKDELFMLIKSIESRVRNQDWETRNAVAAPEMESGSLDGFLKAMGGDESLFQGACDLFAEMMPERLAELGKALEAGQSRDAERVAHNLKAGLDSLGAREISEQISVLEADLRAHDYPAALVRFEHIQKDVCSILAQIQARRETTAPAPLS